MDKIKNIPQKIYLQIGDGDFIDDDFNTFGEVSWHKERIFDNDIEYTLQSSTVTDEQLFAIELKEKSPVDGTSYVNLNPVQSSTVTGKQVISDEGQLPEYIYKDLREHLVIIERKMREASYNNSMLLITALLQKLENYRSSKLSPVSEHSSAGETVSKKEYDKAIEEIANLQKRFKNACDYIDELEPPNRKDE